MQDEYTVRLRKAIFSVCIAFVLTWGLVIYLMWLTDQQEKYIDTLESELFSSSGSSCPDEDSKSDSQIHLSGDRTYALSKM